jgi:hypothetical protein
MLMDFLRERDGTLAKMLNRETYLRPGQRVLRGCYWVHHYAHRESHMVRVENGTFPKCNRCGERVRFESALKDDGELIWGDPDFRAKSALHQ